MVGGAAGTQGLVGPEPLHHPQPCEPGEALLQGPLDPTPDAGGTEDRDERMGRLCDGTPAAAARANGSTSIVSEARMAPRLAAISGGKISSSVLPVRANSFRSISARVAGSANRPNWALTTRGISDMVPQPITRW